jgi:hypothetical protein
LLLMQRLSERPSALAASSIGSISVGGAVSFPSDLSGQMISSYFVELDSFTSPIVLQALSPKRFYPDPPFPHYLELYRVDSLLVLDAGGGTIVAINGFGDTMTLTGLATGYTFTRPVRTVLPGTTLGKVRVGYERTQG